jgi:hypothetical protein
MKIDNSEGKFYPQNILVKNVKNGKSSEMNISKVHYVTQLNQNDFKLTADL